MGTDLESIYVRYGPLVYRRCRQLLRDEALAEDAMQDVFAQLLARRAPLEERGLSSLLYQIATHVSLNRLRTRRRHPEDADERALLQIAHAETLEERSVARALLDRLFRRDQVSTRVMATMYFVDGMSLAEVAAEVGLSVSGVRKRLHGLRLQLEQLTEDGHGRVA